MNPVIVGTGLIAMDVVLRGEAQVPVRRCTGGTCGNVLASLAYLGWRAVPVARLANDRAGEAVQKDLKAWGVETRFLRMPSTRPTPIVIQRLLAGPGGEPVHKFSWTCPCCGSWLPRYTAIAKAAAAQVVAEIDEPAVFFFDRPSPGAIAMATAYSAAGALVVFEPSANGDPRTFEAALKLADIVKYSDQRMAALPRHLSARKQLEIQTLGRSGLRYRFAKGSRTTAWKLLPSIVARELVDSAGAGDWSTAGLLHHVGRTGRAGFESCKHEELEAALHYGQALAAWTCSFEGARGGMYERTVRQFRKDVTTLIDGSKQPKAVVQLPRKDGELAGICPSCAEPSRAGRVSRGARPVRSVA